MKDEDRLKMYLSMADVSRKWVSVMDTKAGFISALNAAVLAIVWSGAKLAEAGPTGKSLAFFISVFSISSLLTSLWAVFPRGSLQRIFSPHSRYKEEFKALSFYGYVGQHYPKGHEHLFFQHVEDMSIQMLCREALEQHYTISHSVCLKERWVTRASGLLFLSLSLVFIGVMVKFYQFL